MSQKKSLVNSGVPPLKLQQVMQSTQQSMNSNRNAYINTINSKVEYPIVSATNSDAYSYFYPGETPLFEHELCPINHDLVNQLLLERFGPESISANSDYPSVSASEAKKSTPQLLETTYPVATDLDEVMRVKDIDNCNVAVLIHDGICVSEMPDCFRPEIEVDPKALPSNEPPEAIFEVNPSPLICPYGTHKSAPYGTHVCETTRGESFVTANNICFSSQTKDSTLSSSFQKQCDDIREGSCSKNDEDGSLSKRWKSLVYTFEKASISHLVLSMKSAKPTCASSFVHKNLDKDPLELFDELCEDKVSSCRPSQIAKLIKHMNLSESWLHESLLPEWTKIYDCAQEMLKTGTNQFDVQQRIEVEDKQLVSLYACIGEMINTHQPLSEEEKADIKNLESIHECIGGMLQGKLYEQVYLSPKSRSMISCVGKLLESKIENKDGVNKLSESVLECTVLILQGELERRSKKSRMRTYLSKLANVFSCKRSIKVD